VLHIQDWLLSVLEGQLFSLLAQARQSGLITSRQCRIAQFLLLTEDEGILQVSVLVTAALTRYACDDHHTVYAPAYRPARITLTWSGSPPL